MNECPKCGSARVEHPLGFKGATYGCGSGGGVQSPSCEIMALRGEVERLRECVRVRDAWIMDRAMCPGLVECDFCEVDCPTETHPLEPKQTTARKGKETQ